MIEVWTVPYDLEINFTQLYYYIDYVLYFCIVLFHILCCIFLFSVFCYMVYCILQDLCHVHSDRSLIQQKTSAITNCFIDSPIPPSLQVDITQDMADKILERKLEATPYLFREAQVIPAPTRPIAHHIPHSPLRIPPPPPQGGTGNPCSHTTYSAPHNPPPPRTGRHR